MKYKLHKELKEKMLTEIEQYDYNLKLFKQLQKNNENTRRLLYIEHRLNCVENAYNQLDPFEKEVYKYIFHNHYNWLYCESMKQINKNTYYHVYNKSLYLLAKEIGEI